MLVLSDSLGTRIAPLCERACAGLLPRRAPVSETTDSRRGHPDRVAPLAACVCLRGLPSTSRSDLFDPERSYQMWRKQSKRISLTLAETKKQSFKRKHQTLMHQNHVGMNQRAEITLPFAFQRFEFLLCHSHFCVSKRFGIGMRSPSLNGKHNAQEILRIFKMHECEKRKNKTTPLRKTQEHAKHATYEKYEK